MPVVTLTFSAPTRLDPASRREGWQAREDPRNRNIKMVMKSEPALLLHLQKYDASWQAETDVTSLNLTYSNGVQNFDVNSFGDQMFLYQSGGNFRARWRDGTGTFPDVDTALEPVGLPGVAALTRSGITGIDDGSRDFVCAYIYDDNGVDGAGPGIDEDLYVRRFSYTTRSWGAPVNRQAYNSPSNIWYGPVTAAWQRIDGSIHYAIVGAVGAFNTADLFYAWENGAGVFQGFERVTAIAVFPNSGFLGTNELDGVPDTLNANQFYLVSVFWTVSSADWANCTLFFYEKDLSVSPSTWKVGVQISNNTNQGAHFPVIFCDTDGTLYIAWHERDTVSGKQAVWVRQRAPLSTTWSASTKVADCIVESSASSITNAAYPGIVRAPRGVPIRNLCITWGDADAVPNQYVYVSCATVRTEEDFAFVDGSGGLIQNHDVRIYDGPAGDNWWRNLGKLNEP